MRAGRIVLIVVGSLIGLLGLAAAVGGGTLLIAGGVARDDQGYFTSSKHPLSTSAYAITSEDLQLGTHAEAGDWFPDGWARVRLRVAADDPSRAVFVGIARQSAVDAYLARSAHDQITDVHDHPFSVDYRHESGDVAPAPPADQTFWAASAVGPGRQTLTWDLEGGRWAVVVMAADASAGLDVQADVGLRVRPLVPVGVTLLVVGLLMLAGGIVLIILGARRPSQPPAIPPGGPSAPWGPDGRAPVAGPAGAPAEPFAQPPGPTPWSAPAPLGDEPPAAPGSPAPPATGPAAGAGAGAPPADPAGERPPV